MKPIVPLFVSLIIAAWVPGLSTFPVRGTGDDQFPGWSQAPVPGDLTPMPASAREARFALGFPGHVGVFTDGARTYVVRWVRTATRKLHPAADCLRALGYRVKPAPIIAGADGAHWGTTKAERGPENLRVRERIIDAAGREWTDVSAWYWPAALNQSAGPWWAVTVFEPQNADLIKAPL